jgi:hypothetical protein
MGECAQMNAPSYTGPDYWGSLDQNWSAPAPSLSSMAAPVKQAKDAEEVVKGLSGLTYAKLGLGAAGAVGSGIEAYLNYRDRQKQMRLQEEMMRNSDRRAETEQRQALRAYEEQGTQRSANTLATMAPVISQAETFRDRLRALRGSV